MIAPGRGRAVVTSDQVAPPSLLTCTFSPAPSAPWVPETVSDVSLVTKSLDQVPLSVAIAVIATAAVGAVVSMVTGWLSCWCRRCRPGPSRAGRR